MPAEEKQGLRIAFFGAMTPLAQEIRDQLAQAPIPVARLRLFDTAGHEGAVTEFGGEARLVAEPDRDLMRETDLSFICGDGDPRSAEYLDWAADGPGMMVDMVGASRGRAQVPIVNCDVNPERLREGTGLVAAPHPIAHPLSTILHRLGEGGALEAVCVTILRPAGEMGKAGIEELHQQTIGLLNLSGIPTEVFGRQVAFNLIPLDLQGEGGEAVETMVREDLLRVLPGTEAPISLRVIQAPIFFGHCYAIHVTMTGKTTREGIERLLEEPDLIRISRGDEGRTPAELATETGIWIAGLTPDPARDGAYWIWAVSDALRSGAARNAVRVAELMAGIHA